MAEDSSAAAGSASDLCVFRRIQEERAVQPGHSNLGVRAGLRKKELRPHSMHCRDVEGQEAKSQSRAESIPPDLPFLVILQIGCVNGRKPYKKGCVNGEGVDRMADKGLGFFEIYLSIWIESGPGSTGESL